MMRAYDLRSVFKRISFAYCIVSDSQIVWLWLTRGVSGT